MQQFHLLSFEGPDDYSRAGGLSTRIEGLFEALVEAGIETHLWFVGDPDLPGHARDRTGFLHRWCQWISQHHRNGVYDGETGKALDYARSLPPRLVEDTLGPHLMAGGQAVVLAEEWHTVEAVLHLDWLLKRLGLRERVSILWNANQTRNLHRVDWDRLRKAAMITTVSRYMKHSMAELGIDAVVIPNGLGSDVLQRPDPEAVRAVRRALKRRVVLTKIARFDPDKRWPFAIDCVVSLKARGLRPILIARGGSEAYGTQVIDRARALDLGVVERSMERPGVTGLLEALQRIEHADVLNLCSELDPEARRVLFRASDAVLANSMREPFGLVGLEAMAAGGLACTGCSGEDYAIPGRNALVLQTDDPHEFVTLYRPLGTDASLIRSIRRAARATARDFAWKRIIMSELMPRAQLARSA